MMDARDNVQGGGYAQGTVNQSPAGEVLSFISEWADHLAGALEQGRETYVFCHCPDERLDPWLCREFHQRVNARLPIPPLPWDEIDTDIASQPRLL
jgi:uncharacterized protein YecE (DUF72 family)